MSKHGVPIYGERTGRSRDRRGHGVRGPLSLPGPLSPRGLRINAHRHREFDTLVIAILNELTPAITQAGLNLEVAVEHAPLLPESWTESVPASTLSSKDDVHTLVIYRLPITQRTQSANETLAVLWEVISHRVAELLSIDPEDLAP